MRALRMCNDQRPMQMRCPSIDYLRRSSFISICKWAAVIREISFEYQHEKIIFSSPMKWWIASFKYLPIESIDRFNRQRHLVPKMCNLSFAMICYFHSIPSTWQRCSEWNPLNLIEIWQRCHVLQFGNVAWKNCQQNPRTERHLVPKMCNFRQFFKQRRSNWIKMNDEMATPIVNISDSLAAPTPSSAENVQFPPIFQVAPL